MTSTLKVMAITTAPDLSMPLALILRLPVKLGSAHKSIHARPLTISPVRKLVAPQIDL